jgi:DNA repair exonuclease SbcCD ATPase subunit
MEMSEPDSDQSVGGLSSDRGKELSVSQMQPSELEPQAVHRVRMDPSITRAVLAKTEEELMESLAALMRNKVEQEQVTRLLAQTHVDTEQAKQELESVRMQVRSAEEEVATRLGDRSRINDEITRVSGELVSLQQKHDQHRELVSDLTSKTAQMQQELNQAHESLAAVKTATQAQVAAHRETVAQLTQVHHEKTALEVSLEPLREEVDGRIKAREVLIEEAVILHGHVSGLSARKEMLTAELSALENARFSLQDSVDRLQAEHGTLVGQIESLRQTVTQQAGESDRLRACLKDLNAEIAERSIATRKKGAATKSTVGLPLLFGTGAQEIAPKWDSYPLESEFHTDDELDAKKVAELVSALPGLDGCMLVKNHGAVLASQLPERLYSLLTVPDRNYELLFDRLENRVEDLNIEKSRLATFKLGDDALTIARSDHAFLFANHKQPKLRPGLAGKLAAIVAEVAKMYP